MAGSAQVYAIFVVIPVLSGKGAFGPFLAEHVVLNRRQLAFPFLLRLLDSWFILHGADFF